MVEINEFIQFALRNCVILDVSTAREALATIDQEAIKQEERDKFEVVMWDGIGEPPVGEAKHFIHEEDAIGRATKDAFATGHVVYFLMREGKLHHYQPFRAYDRGHIKLHNNPDHEHHWEKAGNDHIEIEIEQFVKPRILGDALTKALELHQQKGIQVGMTAYTGQVK